MLYQTLIFSAICTTALSVSEGADAEMSASGEDARIRLTLSLDRLKLAPGETLAVRAGCKGLSEGDVILPAGYHAPLARLYLKTPDNKVFVYPEGGVRFKHSRPLDRGDYRRSTTLTKGQGISVLWWDVPLIDPSPYWFDPHTEEPVKPSFREQGAYKVWAAYSVPEIQEALAEAWHGSITTAQITFVVRDVPVADRRRMPTPEQAEHLEAFLANKKSNLEIKDRLKRALGKTENEGLARRMVELLRTHQPEKPGQPYPEWWQNMDFLVRTRAYRYSPSQHGALGILGPYLDEYAAVQTTQLERWPDDRPNGPHRLPVAFLLTYLEHEPNSPLRQRVEAWARRHVTLSADNPFQASWDILFSLGVLHDGMAWSDAKKILGEPTTRDGDHVEWFRDTGSRKAPSKVVGEITVKEGLVSIKFWKR